MPIPISSESKQVFVSRCIKYLMDNNEVKNVNEAAGHCYGVWEEHKKKSKACIQIDKNDEIIVM